MSAGGINVIWGVEKEAITDCLGVLDIPEEFDVDEFDKIVGLIVWSFAKTDGKSINQLKPSLQPPLNLID